MREAGGRRRAHRVRRARRERAAGRNDSVISRVTTDVTINSGDGDRSCGTVQRRDDGTFAVRITDGVGKGLDAMVTSYAIVTR